MWKLPILLYASLFIKAYVNRSVCSHFLHILYPTDKRRAVKGQSRCFYLLHANVSYVPPFHSSGCTYDKGLIEWWETTFAVIVSTIIFLDVKGRPCTAHWACLLYLSVRSSAPQTYSYHISENHTATLQSPGFPDSPYPPNTYVSWRLHADRGYRIKLEFDTFNLEADCQNDFIKVYDSLVPLEQQVMAEWVVRSCTVLLGSRESGDKKHSQHFPTDISFRC